MKVTLVCSTRDRVVESLDLELPEQTTVALAIELSGWARAFPELGPLAACSLGIWGRKATLETVLRDRDRLEFYRPLKIDPKVARRERFSRQGARASGLFAKRRPGAKPGY